MTRNNDFRGIQIQIVVTIVIFGITKEDTRCEMQGKFVRRGGGKIRVTQTTKNTKMRVRARGV
jgi:hypothetical protein